MLLYFDKLYKGKKKHNVVTRGVSEDEYLFGKASIMTLNELQISSRVFFPFLSLILFCYKVNIIFICRIFLIINNNTRHICSKETVNGIKFRLKGLVHF